MHEAAVKKRPDNARLMAELGADPHGRDGHGMTPLDYCGGGSAVGRAIREGAAVWALRRAVRRLFFVSSVAATGAAAADDGDDDGDTEDCGEGTTNKRRKTPAACLSWREARRQRGRLLPAVTFGPEAGVGGGSGNGNGKRAAALRETARLLQAVFVCVPLDMRRQIVLFV